MKRSIVLLFLAAGLVFGGCIETHVLVTVREDGSGSIEETIRMKKAIGEMMRDMAMSVKDGLQTEDAEGDEAPAQADMPPEAPEDVEMFSEESIRSAAAEMGEGVRYESHEMIDTPEHTGYKATYVFDDVNTVFVSQDPMSKVPDMPGMESSEGEGGDELVAFRFTPGNPATLVIRSPQDRDEGEQADAPPADEAAGEAEAQGGEESAEGMEQMKEFFRDMRMLLQVRVDGGIRETNASYVDGSTITMMDVNFNVLLDDPERLKELDRVEAEGPEAMKELLKSIPGLRVETEEEVRVTFR